LSPTLRRHADPADALRVGLGAHDLQLHRKGFDLDRRRESEGPEARLYGSHELLTQTRAAVDIGDEHHGAVVLLALERLGPQRLMGGGGRLAGAAQDPEGRDDERRETDGQKPHENMRIRPEGLFRLSCDGPEGVGGGSRGERDHRNIH